MFQITISDEFLEDFVRDYIPTQSLKINAAVDSVYEYALKEFR